MHQWIHPGGKQQKDKTNEYLSEEYKNLVCGSSGRLSSRNDSSRDIIAQFAMVIPNKDETAL